MENDRAARSAEENAGPHKTPGVPFLKLFQGPDGVRAGWRVLIFIAVLVASVWLLILGIRAFLSLIHFSHSTVLNVLTPGRAILNEAVILAGLSITDRKST